MIAIYPILIVAIAPALRMATLITVLVGCNSFAQDMAPDVLLKTATMDVIVIISEEEAIAASNPATAAERVELRIQPLFDFTHMTQIAVARNWRAASAAQRQALVAEFATMLVGNYIASLSNYRDRVIDFKPLRAASVSAGITVKMIFKQPGADPSTMDYDIEKLATGWKVRNLRIDGIGLASVYREMFAGKVREAGLDGLITSLVEVNRRGDTRSRLRETEVIYFPIFVWGILQRAR